MKQMKVALAWWAPSLTAGGRAQAIRGNVRGFLEDGHDVDLYWRREIDALRERADDYNLIVIPFFDVQIDTEAHVHLQIGGYDDPDAGADYFNAAFAAADSISVLDPRLALHFATVADLDLGPVRVIPNAPNTDLFPEQPPSQAEGFVLCPKIGGPYKSAEILNQVASQTQSTTFEAHVGTPPPELMPNVSKRPAVPLSAMPRRYAAASMVFNPSEREGLPNVAFESFLSGRLYVSTPNGIGLLQTIPREALDPGDFGMRAGEFIEAYRGQFDRGEHYVSAAPGQLGDVITRLLADEEERRGRALAGLEWIENVASAYDWGTKASLIARLVDPSQGLGEMFGR